MLGLRSSRRESQSSMNAHRKRVNTHRTAHKIHEKYHVHWRIVKQSEVFCLIM